VTNQAGSAGQTSGASPFSSLRHPAFARFVAGQTLCGTAQFLGGLATPFLVNQLTDSNTWVGASSFVALIPAVVGTPLSGTLADRMDRRMLLLVGLSFQVLVMSVVVGLYVSGGLTPWRILLLNFVGGSAASFQWAPIQSMAAVLVPREALVAAVRMVSITFTIGRSAGPAIAALTLAFHGPGLAFAVSLGLYVVGLAILATVRTTWSPSGAEGSLGDEFREGLAYVRARPEMRVAFRLAFSVAGLGAVFAFSLAAGIADDLFASLGVGSLLASAFISGRGGRMSRAVLERRSILLYGAGLVVVASSSWLGVGMFGYLLMGGAHMLHGTTLSTSLQLRVDEEFRGRVMSVFLVSVLSGIPIGGLVFGILGDLIGLRWVVLGAGLALCVDAVVTGRRGAFDLLDREVEPEVDQTGAPTGGSAGPFADPTDSGDDRGSKR
jgi:MFS family permease